jgi:hypothetical protein
MITAKDLEAIKKIKTLIAELGIAKLDIDIMGVNDNPRVHLYFTMPSSQGHTEEQAPSEDPPQS